MSRTSIITSARHDTASIEQAHDAELTALLVKYKRRKKGTETSTNTSTDTSNIGAETETATDTTSGKQADAEPSNETTATESSVQ